MVKVLPNPLPTPPPGTSKDIYDINVNIDEINSKFTSLSAEVDDIKAKLIELSRNFEVEIKLNDDWFGKLLVLLRDKGINLDEPKELKTLAEHVRQQNILWSEKKNSSSDLSANTSAPSTVPYTYEGGKKRRKSIRKRTKKRKSQRQRSHKRKSHRRRSRKK